jgi:hypothetical protein
LIYKSEEFRADSTVLCKWHVQYLVPSTEEVTERVVIKPLVCVTQFVGKYSKQSKQQNDRTWAVHKETELLK